MTIGKLITGGIAASLGLGALALTPALADEIYVRQAAPEGYVAPEGYYEQPVTVVPGPPRYEPPPYVVEVAPPVEVPSRVIVAEPVPRERVIIRQPAPEAVYAPPGPVYAPLPDDGPQAGCQTVQGRDSWGRMITVSSGC